MGFANKTIDKRLSEQDTTIKKLQAAVRVNAYESDRLELSTRRENIRVSGIQEESDEDLIQKKLLIWERQWNSRSKSLI